MSAGAITVLIISYPVMMLVVFFLGALFGDWLAGAPPLGHRWKRRPNR